MFGGLGDAGGGGDHGGVSIADVLAPLGANWLAIMPVTLKRCVLPEDH